MHFRCISLCCCGELVSLLSWYRSRQYTYVTIGSFFSYPECLGQQRTYRRSRINLPYACLTQTRELRIFYIIAVKHRKKQKCIIPFLEAYPPPSRIPLRSSSVQRQGRRREVEKLLRGVCSLQTPLANIIRAINRVPGLPFVNSFNCNVTVLFPKNCPLEQNGEKLGL